MRNGNEKFHSEMRSGLRGTMFCPICIEMPSQKWARKTNMNALLHGQARSQALCWGGGGGGGGAKYGSTGGLKRTQG